MECYVNLIPKEVKKLRRFIVYLLLASLLGIMSLLSFAQQNQSSQKSNLEIETLKKRISELENKLQTVENVEKMELTAKLTDANAKLANAEFNKFERELRNSNDKWLRDWGVFFLAILAVVGFAFWYALKSLIADGIEKRLDGFKAAVAEVGTLKNQLSEAMGQVNILQDQIRILEKEHAVSVLAHSVHLFYHSETDSEQINPIPDRALLDLLADKTRDLSFRYKAMEILVVRESTTVVSPGLELLNSVVSSDFDWKDGWLAEYRLSSLVNFLGHIHTPEVYKGLKNILDRLLSTEDQMLKRVLLAKTTFSLARVSGELNTKDSMSRLKMAIPALEVESDENQDLIALLQHFDKFNEPEGIKEILRNRLTDRMPDVEARCLELLENHAPNFVEEWKVRKATNDTENEESS